MADPAPAVDVAAVVAEIRAEVARKRDAGEYPAALLATLEAELDVDPRAAALEDLADIDTARVPASARGGVSARLAVATKRLVRRGIAWYVRPMLEDQVRLNFALVRRIYDLEARITELEGRLRSGPD